MHARASRCAIGGIDDSSMSIATAARARATVASRVRFPSAAHVRGSQDASYVASIVTIRPPPPLVSTLLLVV
jgi:hypothetical protein